MLQGRASGDLVPPLSGILLHGAGGGARRAQDSKAGLEAGGLRSGKEESAARRFGDNSLQWNGHSGRLRLKTTLCLPIRAFGTRSSLLYSCEGTTSRTVLLCEGLGKDVDGQVRGEALDWGSCVDCVGQGRYD